MPLVSNLTRLLVYGGMTTYSTYYVTCKVACIDWYSKFKYQLHDKYGHPVVPSIDFRRLEFQIYNKMSWSEKASSKVEFFVGKSKHVQQIGSLHSRVGVRIGIPAPFYYKSTIDFLLWEELLKSWYKIDQTVDVESLHKLKESFILSDKAIKFVIARELFRAHTYYNIHSGISIQLSYWLVLYFFTYICEIKTLFGRMPESLKALCYLAFGILLYRFYKRLLGVYQAESDRYIDTKAMKLGVDYAEGGLEYYDKLINRRSLLQTILSTNVEKNVEYTENGEKRPSIIGYVSLETRRNKIVKYLSKLNNGQENEEDEENSSFWKSLFTFEKSKNSTREDLSSSEKS